ncbi:MAG: 16S rRNA (adenine(1518)-N(6)/adenine(1519)-N(6))-dimethyltransferase [Lachnospiraceae bacterium]|nr:16S rRNA (adenine(1518)-N(6)/adenine(1519)-N(6))-dimethyltransferase [Lachnospiraceae bacterium]
MSDLMRSGGTMDVLRRFDFTARKKYGQNFLIDNKILDRIIEASGVSKDDFVIEIGPGLGSMTERLCQAAGRVAAVEIDSGLIPILSETLAPFDNVTLLNQDILKTDISELVRENCGTKDGPLDADGGEPLQGGGEFPTAENAGVDSGFLERAGDEDTLQGGSGNPLAKPSVLTARNNPWPSGFKGKVRVIANLPYYITTPILMELLTSKAPVSSITVMVQKEVADRMRAVPGSKAYGSLSLAVQYYAEAEIVAEVPPSSFIPRPAVSSAIIHLAVREHAPVNADETKLFWVIRAAFNQRRKTLANALKNDPRIHFSREENLKAIAAIGKKDTVRGEELTLQEFSELVQALPW